MHYSSVAKNYLRFFSPLDANRLSKLSLVTKYYFHYTLYKDTI